MANVTTHGRNTVTITGLDADWAWNDDGGFDTSMGLKVSSIQFNPGAANDVMIIRDGGIDATALLNTNPLTTVDPMIKYFNPPRWVRPVIDISDCTLGAAGDAEVIIDYV